MKWIMVWLMGISFLTSCKSKMSDEEQAKMIKKVIMEDPELIANAIKKYPAKIMFALQDAAKNSRKEMAKQEEKSQLGKIQDFIKSPLSPKIRSDETIRGTKGGSLTLVEYSDFQCPYCIKGFDAVVKKLLEKYKGKIQFIYKHLPLSFHSEARIASKYYEAIRLQSEKKAFKFHDELFTASSQQKMRAGKEKYLKEVAKLVGVKNMKKLMKDIKSAAVEKRIKEDELEARKFNISGTPGFILNGIPVKGAYPLSYFENIITMLKNAKKIKL